jgi:glycosyltransferase involved in cell wall biosynthesis
VSDRRRGRRLVVSTTIPLSAKAFLGYQLPALARAGWDVHLITSPGPELEEIEERSGIPVHPLPMRREISLRADIVSLRRWVGLLRELKPLAVMVGTPKAGLLGTLGGLLTGVPTRVYVVRGLRYEGLQGWRRAVSILAERAACAAATGVVAVSPSVRSEMLAHRLVRSAKVVVLDRGTTEGIDTAHFRPALPDEAAGVRHAWRIAPGALVIGFIGRLTKDKGVPELLRAVSDLRANGIDAWLVIAGTPDDVLPLEPEHVELLAQPWVVALGHVDDPRRFYDGVDLVCLPSHREGFPNVAAEAAACGLPLVTTDATGCRDAVVHGVTGLMVPVGDGEALASALRLLAQEPESRARMGQLGRELAVSHYDQTVMARLVDEYLRHETGTDRTESLTPAPASIPRPEGR